MRGYGKSRGLASSATTPCLTRPLMTRGRDAGHFGQFLERERKPAIVAKHRQHAAAGVGFAVGRAVAQPVDGAHRRWIAQPRRAGGEAQHGGHRGERVIGDAGQEGLHFLAHRHGIEHADHAADLRAVVIALPRPPDHAQHLARAQRHLDESARQAAALGRLVIQEAGQAAVWSARRPDRLRQRIPGCSCATGLPVWAFGAKPLALEDARMTTQRGRDR